MKYNYFNNRTWQSLPSLENKDKDIYIMKYLNIKMNNGKLIKENYQEEKEDIQKY